MKFLDPCNDVAFKKVFGNEKHPDMFISFLNAVLNLAGEKEIRTIEWLSPLHTPRIRLPSILVLLRDMLQQPNGLHCIDMILRYVFSAVESVTVEQLQTVAEQSLKGEIAMTLAEQLRREGEKKGQQEGYEQGLLEGIELALTIKFGEGTTQKIMPVIRAMHDLTRLKAIKDAIKTVQNFSELQTMIGA